jgi:uncharacterized membrane protein
MNEPPSRNPAPVGSGGAGAARESAAGVGREAGEPALFDAVLHPHRSLSPFGFVILMTCVGLVSFTAGIVFLLAGAWPVFGFFGLDAALIYIAFRMSYRSGQLHETVRLTRTALTVRRVSPSGAVKSWTFEPYWLRVEMDDPPEHHSQLRLTSHGRALVIGSFLSPAERLDLARALGTALHRQHAAARA